MYHISRNKITKKYNKPTSSLRPGLYGADPLATVTGQWPSAAVNHRQGDMLDNAVGNGKNASW